MLNYIHIYVLIYIICEQIIYIYMYTYIYTHIYILYTNKSSGGDGILVELFQILKDDAVKVLHLICQQIWKTQPWTQDWKSSVFIPIPKKGNAKECSATAQLHSSQSICLQCRRPGFYPCVRKIPWRRKWQPTPVFLPGESHGRRSLVGDSPQGRRVRHD